MVLLILLTAFKRILLYEAYLTISSKNNSSSINSTALEQTSLYKVFLASSAKIGYYPHLVKTKEYGEFLKKLKKNK